jgi:hypothetical protein
MVTGYRAYRGKQGIEYLLGRGGGFLFRLGTKRFDVYNRKGKRVNILGCFKGLRPGGVGEKTPYYEYEGEYKPPRFRVLRRTKEAERKGLEALRKTRMRKHGDQELGNAQRACNRYATKRCGPRIDTGLIPAAAADRAGVQEVKTVI